MKKSLKASYTVEASMLMPLVLFFIFQGAAPEKWMLEAGEYTMSRFAGLYGLSYEGMIVNSSDAKKLSAKV